MHASPAFLTQTLLSKYSRDGGRGFGRGTCEQKGFQRMTWINRVASRLSAYNIAICLEGHFDQGKFDPNCSIRP